MNIDEMPAGREMDALVAEKVMGWSRETGLDGWDDMWPPGEDGNIKKRVTAPSFDDLPRYSIDIAAAWKIVSRIRHSFSLCHPLTTGNCWQAKFEDYEDRTWHDEVIVRATASAAPLAICRAALKFVGCMERMFGQNMWKEYIKRRANEH